MHEGRYEIDGAIVKQILTDAKLLSISEFLLGSFMIVFQQDFARQHLTSIKFAPSFDGVFTLYTPGPVVYLTDYVALREAFVERGSLIHFDCGILTSVRVSK